MWRWILAVLALLAGLWFGNLATFNWWAAGGPPTVNRAAYESRVPGPRPREVSADPEVRLEDAE